MFKTILAQGITILAHVERAGPGIFLDAFDAVYGEHAKHMA